MLTNESSWPGHEKEEEKDHVGQLGLFGTALGKLFFPKDDKQGRRYFFAATAWNMNL